MRVAVEAGRRQGYIGKGRQKWPVVGIDAVSQGIVGRLVEARNENASGYAQCDVHYVIAETTAVRKSLEIVVKNAETIGAGRDRHGHVEAQHLRRHDIGGLIDSRNAGEEDLYQVV